MQEKTAEAKKEIGWAFRQRNNFKRSPNPESIIGPKRNDDGLYIVVYGASGYSSMPVSGDVAERLLKQTPNGYRVPYQYGYNTPTEKKNRGL